MKANEENTASLEDDEVFTNSIVKTEHSGIITVNDEDPHIYCNIHRSIIVIDEEKLRLNIKEFKNYLSANNGNLTWFGIGISIILTLLTADFHTVLFISSDLIKSSFILTLIYIIYKICGFYMNKSSYEITDEDMFVERCKTKIDADK